MNPIVKEHLISATNTFITSFLVVAGATLSSGDIAWTGAFWLSVLTVAARAAMKEVIARFAPLSLGGREE